MGLKLDVTNESLIAEGAAADIDITLTPKGAGNLLFDVHTWPNSDGTSGQVIQTNGAGVLSFTDNLGSNEKADDVFRIIGSVDATKKLAFEVDGLTTATTRTWTAPDQNLDLTPTTGSFQGSDAGLTDIAGLAVTDGNFIVGDGANWVAESGATARASMGAGTLDNIVEDTTPQLGGNLDVNGNIITSAANGDVEVSPNGTGVIVLHSNIRIRKFTVQTTDGTQTVIGSIPIVDDQSIGVTITGIGRENATGDTLYVKMEVVIRREGVTTQLVGEPIRTFMNDAGASAWDIDAVADDTSDELDIRVTGEAAHTIDWVVRADSIEE